MYSQSVSNKNTGCYECIWVTKWWHHNSRQARRNEINISNDVVNHSRVTPLYILMWRWHQKSCQKDYSVKIIMEVFSLPIFLHQQLTSLERLETQKTSVQLKECSSNVWRYFFKDLAVKFSKLPIKFDTGKNLSATLKIAEPFWHNITKSHLIIKHKQTDSIKAIWISGMRNDHYRLYLQSN